MNKDSRVTVALLFYTQELSHCSSQWGYWFVFVWMCCRMARDPTGISRRGWKMWEVDSRMLVSLFL